MTFESWNIYRIIHSWSGSDLHKTFVCLKMINFTPISNAISFFIYSKKKLISHIYFCVNLEYFGVKIMLTSKCIKVISYLNAYRYCRYLNCTTSTKGISIFNVVLSFWRIKSFQIFFTNSIPYQTVDQIMIMISMELMFPEQWSLSTIYKNGYWYLMINLQNINS